MAGAGVVTYVNIGREVNLATVRHCSLREIAKEDHNISRTDWLHC